MSMMVRAASERFIYSPDNIAKNFEQISSDIVDTASRQLIVKWYRSSYADLQIWYDQEKSKIIRQQFSFLGLIVEWNHIQGVRTGCILDSSEKKIENHQVLKVNYDKGTQKDSVNMVVEVLRLTHSVSDLQEIISNYENSPKLSRWQSLFIIIKHLFFKKTTRRPKK